MGILGCDPNGRWQHFPQLPEIILPVSKASTTVIIYNELKAVANHWLLHISVSHYCTRTQCLTLNMLSPTIHTPSILHSKTRVQYCKLLADWNYCHQTETSSAVMTSLTEITGAIGVWHSGHSCQPVLTLIQYITDAVHLIVSWLKTEID